MNKTLRILFAGICLMPIGTVLGQVKFTAYANPPVIGRHEFVQVEFTVENGTDIQQIIPPAFKGFTIISGPNQTTGYRNINGVVSNTYSISYLLRPNAMGSFAIAPAKVTAGGKDYKSNALTVEVTNSAQGNSPSVSPPGGMGNFDPLEEIMKQRPVFTDYVLKASENPEEKIKKNLFIRVDVNKKSCYLGEPVVATYKLYTRLKSESNFTRNPSFNGFSVVDMQLPDVSQYSTEKIGGREYNVYILRKVQLYPLQPGTIELESAEVENNIRFIREEYIKNSRIDPAMLSETDLISMPAEAYVNKKIAVTNAPLYITVNDVPAASRPASYNGAAGDFSITAAVEKTQLTTDDAGKLLLTIEGSGNMPLLLAPDINWPDGIEAFDPKIHDNINKAAVPVSGSKSFEYSFTIAKPGSYQLPAIKFSWLDTKSGRFRTDSTKPVNLNVTQGTGKTVDTASLAQAPNEKFFNRLFSNRWWVAGPVIVLIITGLLLWLRREQRKDKRKAATSAAATVQPIPDTGMTGEQEHIPAVSVNWLEEAAHLLEQQASPDFYKTLNAGFKKFLCSHLQLGTDGLSKKTVADALDKKSVSNDTILQCLQLMDDIEFQLYTPLTDAAQEQEMYNRASILIEKLNYH